MQIRNLPKNFYKLYSYARTQELLAERRAPHEKVVRNWDVLKQRGVDDKTLQKTLNISRATFYRKRKLLRNLLLGILPPSKRPKKVRKPCWKEADRQLVLQIRRENPSYGKEKIAIILKRDHGWRLSESTAGRILKSLMNEGLVTRSISALRIKKKRNFKGHAKPWTFKKYELMELGERVQVDHMTVTKNGLSFKHFQAWERKSKHLAAQIYRSAKSSDAKKFLLEFVKNSPHPIKSIQVDGGSEFRADFEEACGELSIPLIVLPPASPKYNGGVERANRTLREELYERHDLLADSVGAMRFELEKIIKKYNNYRPHSGLKGLTPMQYINSTYAETNLSHML